MAEDNNYKIFLFLLDTSAISSYSDTMRRKIPLYLWLIFLLTIVSGASFVLTAPLPVAAQTVESILQNYCRPSIGAYVIPNPRGTGEIACGTAPNICGIPYDLNGDGLVRDSAGNPVNWQAVDDCWNSGARPNERCNGWGMCYGEVPTCCYLLEETGDPFKCAYPDRLYCLPQQCNRIPANVNNQNCGLSIGTWCQNDCGISRSNIPYIPLAQRLNPSAPTATPTPIGQPPTATPTTQPGATNTPTPLLGSTSTPVPPACSPGVCTEAMKQAGDYNCDCVVDTQQKDFTDWRADFLNPLIQAALRYFEYWRRAFFRLGGGGVPLPTPDPSCTVVFQWDQSKGGIVRTATSDPAKDDLLVSWIGNVAGATSYHVKITASDGTVFADQDAAGFFQSTINSAETYNIVVTAVGTCAVLTGKSAPISAATPTPIPAVTATPVPPGVPTNTPTPTVQPFACPPTSSNTYDVILREASYIGAQLYNPADPAPNNHPDLNLAIRGFMPYAAVAAISGGSPRRPLPPQFTTMFLPVRKGPIVSTYRVYDWNWITRSKGLLLTNPEVTMVGIAATPGDAIYVPLSDYHIGENVPSEADVKNPYLASVLYVDQNKLTITYTRDDSAARGFVLHFEDICVDPNLVDAYRINGLNSITNRGYMIALRSWRNMYASQDITSPPIGKARTGEVKISIRSEGTFLDPRWQDWWQL